MSETSPTRSSGCWDLCEDKLISLGIFQTDVSIGLCCSLTSPGSLCRHHAGPGEDNDVHLGPRTVTLP